MLECLCRACRNNDSLLSLLNGCVRSLCCLLNARFRLHLSSNVFIGETSRNDYMFRILNPSVSLKSENSCIASRRRGYPIRLLRHDPEASSGQTPPMTMTLRYVIPEDSNRISIFRNTGFRLHLSSNVFIGET